jgi:hypothetical protein
MMHDRQLFEQLPQMANGAQSGGGSQCCELTFQVSVWFGGQAITASNCSAAHDDACRWCTGQIPTTLTFSSPLVSFSSHLSTSDCEYILRLAQSHLIYGCVLGLLWFLQLHYTLSQLLPGQSRHSLTVRGIAFRLQQHLSMLGAVASKLIVMKYCHVAEMIHVEAGMPPGWKCV